MIGQKEKIEDVKDGDANADETPKMGKGKALISISIDKSEDAEGKEGVSISTELNGDFEVMVKSFAALVSQIGRGLLDNLGGNPILRMLGVMELSRAVTEAVKNGFQIPSDFVRSEEGGKSCDCPACKIRKAFEEQDKAQTELDKAKQTAPGPDGVQ